ncbi:alpha/beta hydrolase [Streptomyces sp. NBC_00286]|uniref:alpha/beta hydrolase n=1 Tax=Streptomyces sp. NBC_00286 TaxID=2975701 RepID=UPI002E2CF9E2|nr:alpha/beta hydrolase [Streptomyces sp. NBC_00286]
MITIRAATYRTAAAALVLAGLTACTAAGPEATGTSPEATVAEREASTGKSAASAVPGLGRFYDQHLAWGKCAHDPDDTTGQDLDKAGAECANLTVPLDYAVPQGRTIPVAMSRLQATDTRRRIGSILINNGGPGVPALASPPDVRAAMGEVGARYDIIGFDPRFVGRSTPLDCGWPIGNALFSAGLSRASFDRQVELQKSLADKCRATNASVLPHINTRNTARDMDVIRGALDERRISYLGYSYGTYLGTVYTQMFPGRFDRMVLDGSVAPSSYTPQLLKGLEPENEQALSAWATWAAQRRGTYSLGRTRVEVLATIDRVMSAAARKPLTVGTAPDLFRIDDTQVPLLLFMGLSDDTDSARDALAGQLSVLAKAADGQPAPLTPEFAAVLRVFLTDEDTNLGTVQTALACADGTASRNIEQYWRDIEASRRTHPLFGPLANNIVPCAFWKTPPEKPIRVRDDAAMLIVAATGDPRTTYKSSSELHRLLPSSKLLTLKGANRHGLYGQYGNACIDHEVNQYLTSGELPARDETCETQGT